MSVHFSGPDLAGLRAEPGPYAVPILRQEALTAQSAQISIVSGATYTSDGYVRSLHSALDGARG